ncbi:MAG: asparagine--tRNA ligase, partial [Oscillospiraceae bacterium]|nr:asparagine--tRNA ligase [Oscillospiraceae bacterium]
MKRTELKKLHEAPESFSETVTVCGWIKSLRTGKGIAFISISDGSCFTPVQVVAEADKLNNFEEVSKLNTGAAISVLGRVISTPNAKQKFEINADRIEIEGISSPDYPLQKKAHGLEYLRTISHLRMRTNTFQAVFKIRSAAAQALHRFFAENGFVYAHTPIITANDCEGAGEMFRVTTIDPDDTPKNGEGRTDYAEDFFGQPAFLTVSGQLEGECMAMAFGKIYTFGPTFRAEKSYTPRHAAEFWMIEPEIAFADLEDDMELAENMLKYVLNALLKE